MEHLNTLSRRVFHPGLLSFICLSLIPAASVKAKTSAASRQRGRKSRSSAGYYLTAHRRPVRLQVQPSSSRWRSPTQRCRIMWQDETVMRRDGRVETVWLLQQTTDKRDKNTHWVLSVVVAQGFWRQRSVTWARGWQRELVSNKQAGSKICNKASDNQLCDILV